MTQGESPPPVDGPGSGPPLGEGPPPTDSEGIAALLGRSLASLSSMADARVQLAVLEFREERDRAQTRLALMLGIGLATGFALLSLNGWIAALMWPWLGWGSLAALAGFWALVAMVAALRLRSLSQRAERPFAATLREFEQDRAWLSRQLGKRR